MGKQREHVPADEAVVSTSPRVATSRSTAKKSKSSRTVTKLVQTQAPESGLEDLLELSFAYYWEQDSEYRFTESRIQFDKETRTLPKAMIGRRRWDNNAIAISDNGTWERHKADLDARRPFKGFLYKLPLGNGTFRYISANGQPIYDGAGAFIGYRGIARDVTQEQRTVQLLMLEHSVTRSLADSNDLNEALRSAIKAICESEGYEVGQYWRVDETGHNIRFFEGWQIADPALDEYMQMNRDAVFERGRGIMGLVWDSGNPLWIPDVLNDTRILRKELLRKINCQTIFLLPVTWSGQVIGVLDFSSRHILAEPDEVLLNVIRALGAQIGHFYHRLLSQQLLRESEERLYSTFELAAIGIAHVNADGRFIYANPKLCEILGYTQKELVGMTVQQVSHPDDLNVAREQLAKLRAGEIKSFTVEKRNIRKDGTILWVGISIALKHDENGNPQHEISVYENISARKHAEEVLRESEERFRALADLSSDWYWEMDTDFRLTRLEGRSSEAGKDNKGNSVIGQCRWDTGLRIENAGGWAAHQDLLKQHRPFRDVVIYREMPDGKNVYFSISGEPLFDEYKHFKGYRGVGKDITERKQAEARIQYLATHDGLTGLPNRVMFNGMLNLAIETSKRYKHKFAILFIDLDRFKTINDTLGHEAGDILLKEMALRLKGCLRTSDVLARLGGDEFVVLVQKLDKPSQAAQVARKMLSTAIQPMEIVGHECRVTASIGIAIYPRDADDEQSLMKNADIAMYLAKEEGKNNFQFYSKKIQSLSHEKLALESGIRNAMERNELALHYQAKRDLQSGAITGVEALLRWNSPVLGSVSPAQFIPVAEETGMIIPIGRWVLKTACEQNMAWQRAGLPPVCMAINLSPRQFNDQELIRNIRETLDETGMSPACLEIEITESIVMHNSDHALKLLEAIKKMGVRLAIDDFGTGYSSLAQLKRFPIDTLKVDRSFIRDLPEDSEDKAITEAIISMGRKLSLNIVAEGVETEAQEAYLRERACNEMQGFYFSKPLPAEEFEALLMKHSAEQAKAG